MNNCLNFLYRFLPKNTKTITWLYVLSISVVITELLVALSFANSRERQVEDSAHFINLVGEQTMLSQRILLSAELLVEREDAAVSQGIRADLDRFEATQRRFLNDPSVPDSIVEFLTSQDNSTSVDVLFHDFISRARSIVLNPDRDELDDWTNFVRTEILPQTEALAAAFVTEAEVNLDRLHRAWTGSIVIAALILALEAVFVFLPSQSLIIRAFREKEQKAKELLQANERLEAEQQRLLESISEANSLRQEQAEFTYALSHDMKAPINSVRMLHGELVEILQDHPDEDVMLFLGHLRATTDRMSQLVEDVLNYTSTLGEMAEMKDVDLNEICKGVVEDLRADIRSANGSVTVKDLPTVQGCPSQLRMLFQNLISNGIKFRSPDVDSVIHIGCVDDNSEAVSVEVRDNGIGIDAADKDRIFGLFNRLHLREDYPGTGIGLALCRRIIANHFGRIDIDSVLGEGSKFIVRLPKGQMQ